MTRSKWRTIAVWQLSGALLAFVAMTALSLFGLFQWSEDTLAQSIGNTALQAAFLLVVGSPLVYLFLAGWARLAQWSPRIERSPVARFGGLLVATVAATLIVLWCDYTVWEIRSGRGWRPSTVYPTFVANSEGTVIICLMFCVALLSPRIVVRSLRGALFVP